MIAPALPARRRRRLAAIALKPILHDVMIKLLGLEQARVRLPRHRSFRPGHFWRQPMGVECIRLADAFLENLVELAAEGGPDRSPFRAQPEPHGDLATRRDRELVISRRLRADPFWVYRAASPPNHIFVKGIFHVGVGIPGAENSREIGLVVGEKELR